MRIIFTRFVVTDVKVECGSRKCQTGGQADGNGNGCRIGVPLQSARPPVRPSAYNRHRSRRRRRVGQGDLDHEAAVLSGEL